MISTTSPPEQKPAPAAGDHHHPSVAAMGQLGEQVAQIRVDVEGQRAEFLRPRQRDRRNAVRDVEIEVLPVVA